MREGRSSQTAAFVALWRALGAYLPAEAVLCTDPLAWSFAPPGVGRLRLAAERFPAATGRVLLASPLRRLLLWIQLRTRAIDDLTLDFAQRGGRQVLVLGAGFDSRAIRLAPALAGTRFFEVDHPATLGRKRFVLDSLGVSPHAQRLPWDFERDPLGELAPRLAALGHERDRPTLTLWEGVIPYLSERAVEATLAAVRGLGSEGSEVVLHYIERQRIEGRTVWHLAAKHVGEPLRFGWDPTALPAWLRARGFELVSDRSDLELARELFTGPWADAAGQVQGAGGRIALARPR